MTKEGKYITKNISNEILIGMYSNLLYKNTSSVLEVLKTTHIYCVFYNY